jgi:hypothetical protein
MRVKLFGYLCHSGIVFHHNTSEESKMYKLSFYGNLFAPPVSFLPLFLKHRIPLNNIFNFSFQLSEFTPRRHHRDLSVNAT